MRPRALLLLAFPLLGACGLVPLPEQTARDFYVANTVGDVSPGEVIYLADNMLSELNVPQLPTQGVTIDAGLTYRGAAPRLHLELFVSATRPDCPVVQPPPGLPDYSDALRCPGFAGGTVLADVLLTPGVPQPLHLTGSVLDQAVRRGTLYLGIRRLEGAQLAGEYLAVTNIRLRGRL